MHHHRQWPNMICGANSPNYFEKMDYLPKLIFLNTKNNQCHTFVLIQCGTKLKHFRINQTGDTQLETSICDSARSLLRTFYRRKSNYKIYKDTHILTTFFNIPFWWLVMSEIFVLHSLKWYYQALMTVSNTSCHHQLPATLSWNEKTTLTYRLRVTCYVSSVKIMTETSKIFHVSWQWTSTKKY